MATTIKGAKPVTIERIKSIKKFGNLSDEQAQEVLDNLKFLVKLAIKVTQNLQ